MTPEKFREFLDYDEISGVFTWKIGRKGKAKKGTIAGTVSKKGYRTIHFNGKMYKAHRLAWFLTYSEWPVEQVDHINGAKDDNRISNLREATNSQNQRNRGAQSNNSLGVKGVCFHKRTKKWVAQITLNGRRTHLGLFSDIDDAAKAYALAAKEHYGDFAKF